MFSREQRQRAVDLYFSEGMTPGRVIAELGYPSESCLARWVSRDPRHGRGRRFSYTLGVGVGGRQARRRRGALRRRRQGRRLLAGERVEVGRRVREERNRWAHARRR